MGSASYAQCPPSLCEGLCRSTNVAPNLIQSRRVMFSATNTSTRTGVTPNKPHSVATRTPLGTKSGFVGHTYVQVVGLSVCKPISNDYLPTLEANPPTLLYAGKYANPNAQGAQTVFNNWAALGCRRMASQYGDPEPRNARAT